jgi:ribosomal protein S6--L-glutamate ligase
MQKTILILGNPSSWSTQEIAKEVTNAGHIATVRQPGDCFPFLSESRGHDRIYFRSKESAKSERLYTRNIDAVITRLGAGTRYGRYVVKAFQNNGIFTANISECIHLCGDKFATAQVLSKAKIGIPRQLLIYQSKDPEEAIALVDKKPPLICKKISGSEGKGVFIISDSLAGKMTLESFDDSYLVLQRYCNKRSPDKKSDIRAFTIGSETSKPEIYAYERISESDDPRANFSIHHSGRPVELIALEQDMVLRAARAVGGGVVGVDLIRDQDVASPLIIEVNSNPSLAGITEVLNVNIARRIVAYVLRECERPTKNRPFYDGITATAFDMTPAAPTNEGVLLSELETLAVSTQQKANLQPFAISDSEIVEKIQKLIKLVKNGR